MSNMISSCQQQRNHGQHDETLLKYLNNVSHQLFKLLDFENITESSPIKTRTDTKHVKSKLTNESNGKTSSRCCRQTANESAPKRRLSKKQVAKPMKSSKSAQIRETQYDGDGGKRPRQQRRRTKVSEKDELKPARDRNQEICLLQSNQIQANSSHEDNNNNNQKTDLDCQTAAHTDLDGQLSLNIGDELNHDIISGSITPTTTHLSPIEPTIAQLGACQQTSANDNAAIASSNGCYFGLAQRSTNANGTSNSASSEDHFSGADHRDGNSDELLTSLSNSMQVGLASSHQLNTQLLLPIAVIEDNSSTLLQPLGVDCYTNNPHQQHYSLTTPTTPFHHHHHNQLQHNQHHHNQHDQADYEQLTGASHQHELGQSQWLGPMMSCHSLDGDQHQANNSTSANNPTITSSSSPSNSINNNPIASHELDSNQQHSALNHTQPLLHNLHHHHHHQHQQHHHHHHRPQLQAHNQDLNLQSHLNNHHQQDQFASLYQQQTSASYYNGDLSSAHSNNNPNNEPGANVDHDHQRDSTSARTPSNCAGFVSTSQTHQIHPVEQVYNDHHSSHHQHHQHHQHNQQQQQQQHQSQDHFNQPLPHEHHYNSALHEHHSYHQPNHHHQQQQQHVIHHHPNSNPNQHHNPHHMLHGLVNGIEPSSVILQDINLASATWASPEDLYSI